MKLKLTDKIRKFFGTRAADGDEPFPGLQQLTQLGGHVQYVEGTRMGGSGSRENGMGSASGSGALNNPNLQHATGRGAMPSTLSQKADLASNPRTTGQDEAYCLQNEVHFPQLLLTLQTGTPEQKAVATEALFNYTAESDAARQRATQAGVVIHLIDLLRIGTDHGKMYAAYTLSSLTSIEEALEQMCLLGAIPALISILSTCPLLVCKKGAMRALGRLARNDQAAADIVAANGLTPIISLLARPDSSLVRRCLIALYFIGADKDTLQQAIGAAGALPGLLTLACSDSPDVQAEATDVLKVLCRNAACGHSLAELGGIEVLAGLLHTGLTSRTKASAARALQRLNDFPELREQLANSSARDILADASASGSLLNTNAAVKIIQTGAAVVPSSNSACDAGPVQSSKPGAVLAAGTGKLAFERDRQTQLASGTGSTIPAVAGSAAEPAGNQAEAAVPAVPAATADADDELAVVEVEDVKQLAEVLANSANKWLREKAAAAVEQLAVDDPQACRELAEMGALGSLLNMLAAGNGSVTRRAGARALGKLGDDPVLLRRMAEPGFILKLLQAAPELNGSALRAVMKLLQCLAANDQTRAAFPRLNCAAHIMQVIEGMRSGNAALSTAGPEEHGIALCRPGLSGVSTRLDLAAETADATAAARALEVLLALCMADPAVLTEVKQYPGGFRLLVSKLQQGPRVLAPPILQLLACLARSKAHQEDLLKGGVVPVLLGLYRSDDAAVAMQAAKVMELLSEPAAQILERSMSKGDMAISSVASSTAPSAEKNEAARPLSPMRTGNRPAPYSGGLPSQDTAASSSFKQNSSQVSGSAFNNSAGSSIDALQPNSSGQLAADAVPAGSHRYASPSRAAGDASGRPTSRASSLLNNSSINAALSRLNAGRASKSFTASAGKPGSTANAVQGLLADDSATSAASRSISPARLQPVPQQLQQQQQQRPQELAVSKLPKRPLTPDGAASTSKQEPAAMPSAAAVRPGTAEAVPTAAAGSHRASVANRDRPQSAAVESPARPVSASRSKPSAPVRNSSSPAAAAAQRQRLVPLKKPSLPGLQNDALVVAAPAASAEPPMQPQQQPQQRRAEPEPAAEGQPRQPVLQMAAAFQAAASAASASPGSPRQRQYSQQRQQGSPDSTPSSAAVAADANGAPVPAAGGTPPAIAGNSSAAELQPAAVFAAAAIGSSSDGKQDKVLPNVAAAGSGATAADADDLLSSTYDNLHGLLMKKSDIEVCRTAEGRKCRLGEGGFGVVYKAVMNGVDEVAVKLVKADSPSRKELELFLKEVQTLAKLHHRNIVQFYGACLETGSMFFVTELMKGGDLYTALRHHAETMKWERLGRKVALDVALGLNYLHAQRPPMMHRDLKSPNVLLSEEGVAKIADVGMVRSQVKDLVTAQPVMTPLWAAPEVVRHERASIKADIWSYGILIWELISGEDITEYQPLSISRQVGPSPNAKALALPAKCPAVARKLFMACTQMDPERRPGAQTLVEWLRADMAQNRF